MPNRHIDLDAGGLYVFRNMLGKELILDKPTICTGKMTVPAGEEFEADNSVMRLTRFRFAKLVREIRSPEQEKAIMSRFLNKVFCGDALQLLKALPTASVHAVMPDPMYGTAKRCVYGWGPDPAKGDPDRHWTYQQPYYEQARRVLKPGGVLAWAQGFKFQHRFDEWFGAHQVWSPICTAQGLNFTPNIWVVQTRERQPISHPNDMRVWVNRGVFAPLKDEHPCPKPIEEILFMIQALTKPGDIILDCFCGLGSGIVAAKQSACHWIGCDIWKPYCQRAMKRLEECDLM